MRLRNRTPEPAAPPAPEPAVEPTPPQAAGPAPNSRESLIAERRRALAIAARYSMATVDLSATRPEPGAPELISESVARSVCAIPLAVRNDTVFVAVAEPTDAVVSALQEAIGRQLVLQVAAPSDILLSISHNYRALTGISDQVKAFEARDVVRKETARGDVAAESATGDDAPVVRVVRAVVTQALRDRASDVHIEPKPEHIRVRFRIDGALHDVLTLPASMAPAVVSRIKILAGMNIVEKRRPQDGQMSTEVDDKEVDIRVSTTPVVGGEKVVLRLLDKSRPLFRLSGLGMAEDTAARFSTLLRSPYGMVICSGPTGSGKTTTLYGSLGEINSPERNIVTIEDPVEYTFGSISQIQINEQAGITFASGLRSILRQDPDVILVGEVRDVETARIAVQAALTGHFVLSSLHATDAPAAMHRLLDMGIEPFLVASSVTGVLAQRLVRRVCDHCREYYQPTPEEMAYLDSIGGTPPPSGFTRGAGCDRCARTGFMERVGVYELMPVTDHIRRLVLDNAPHDEIRRAARQAGMRTLQDEAARLVTSGVSTLGEVLRSIYLVGS